jgi:hypothetical protein
MSQLETIKILRNALTSEPMSLLPTKPDSRVSIQTFKWFISQKKRSTSDFIENCDVLYSHSI